MSKPYATEAERQAARRKTYRDSKTRRNERKAAAEEWVTKLINQGTGPAARRVLMLDILDRQKQEAL